MANITKRGNSYRIRVSAGYDNENKQIVHSMTWTPSPNLTQKQIEKELSKQVFLFEEKCKNGLYINSSIKFSDFAQRWINDYAQKQLKVKTVTRYKELLKRINQGIGHIKLEKLQPTHLLQFYENLKEKDIREDIKYKCIIDLKYELAKSNLTKTKFSKIVGISTATLNQACKGNNVSFLSAQKISNGLNYKIKDIFQKDTSKMYLSDETVRYYHRLISSILQTAVQWQIIPSNPCSRIKPPKVVKKESKYLEDTDILKLFECLKNEPLQYKTMIILLIYSGMRRGELLGLKWSDVDFKKKTIYIHQELLYLPKKGIFEETTKTYESKRIIKIADIAIDILLEHKNEQENNKSKIGDQWIENNYIFTQWNGLPFHPDTLTSWFSKFVKKYNLPDVTIHSLRHTNASLLIANGVNIITVSKRLGHSNASTTTDIYSHAIKSADEAAANTLQNLLLNKNK